MKKFAYYIKDGQYTLEPNGVAVGRVGCATEEQARAIVEYMHILNPITVENDELQDNE